MHYPKRFFLGNCNFAKECRNFLLKFWFYNLFSFNNDGVEEMETCWIFKHALATLKFVVAIAYSFYRSSTGMKSCFRLCFSRNYSNIISGTSITSSLYLNFDSSFGGCLYNAHFSRNSYVKPWLVHSVSSSIKLWENCILEFCRHGKVICMNKKWVGKRLECCKLNRQALYWSALIIVLKLFVWCKKIGALSS